jgi:POT family proton-dependent oligopeptide transporter
MTQDPTSEFASPAATAVAGGIHPAAVPGGPTFFGHPRGLATLFFTEFWERFSFYGLKALLQLFMTAAFLRGGLNFTDSKAGAIYGLYGSFVYLTSLPGGWLADRLLGQRRAVFVGGCIIAAGHFTMAVPGTATFFLGLTLIVTGTGLLKPNVSTMVGELYPEGGARRDAGFSIFYMGINLGASISPLICGPLGEKVNWHYGFAAAGFGMVLGLIQYVRGGRYLGDAGLRPNAGIDPAERRKAFRILGVAGLLLAVVVGTVFFFGFTAEQIANSTGIAIFSLAVVYLVYQLTLGELDGTEKKRMIVIFILFVFSTLFWAAFEQAGSSLTLFADRLTDRNVLGWQVPTSTLQAINPAFIIFVAPIFAALWVSLSKAGKEPSSPAKFSLGLILVSFGFLVMAGAAILTQGGAHKVSPLWLILTYFFFTCGELCLSPVGLSTVTKLAPHRKVSQMMGVWFMSISLGNLLAGLIGGRFSSYPLPQIFGLVFAVTAGAGLILALLVRPIRRMMGDVH